METTASAGSDDKTFLGAKEGSTDHHRWIPGHKGVQGNERADQEAKKAAKGDVHAPPNLPRLLRRALLHNRASLQKSFVGRLKRRYEHQWMRSKRYGRLRTMSTVCTQTAYKKLSGPLARAHNSILIQLRTGHSLLNSHLLYGPVVASFESGGTVNAFPPVAL